MSNTWMYEGWSSGDLHQARDKHYSDIEDERSSIQELTQRIDYLYAQIPKLSPEL